MSGLRNLTQLVETGDDKTVIDAALCWASRVADPLVAVMRQAGSSRERSERGPLGRAIRQREALKIQSLS